MAKGHLFPDDPDRGASPWSSLLVRAFVLSFALALLAVVAVLSYRRLGDFERDVFWRGHTYEVIDHIEGTRSALLGADAMRRSYRLTRHPPDKDEMEARIRAGSGELDEVERLSRDNAGQQARIAALRPLIAERVEVMRDGLELPSFELLEPAVRDAQRARQTRGAELAAEVGRRLDAMAEEERALLAARQERLVASGHATRRTLAMGSVAGIALVLLALLLHARESRARSLAQRDLARTNLLFEVLLSESTDVIAVKDTQGRYLLINRAGCENLGREEEDILGKTDLELLSGGTGESVMKLDRDVLRHGEVTTMEQVASVGDRTWTFHSTKSPFRDPDGHVLGIIAISRDITERKRLELELQESLRAQALRDPMTDLYNRRYLDATLPREILRVGRRSSPLSVIMVDVDHFKKLNDTAGHLAGDEALKEVARVLAAGVRREDVACRYGGEEFALILPELPLAAAMDRAELLRRRIEELPTELGGHKIGRVTASFGVACFPLHGSSSEDVLAAADAALYRAKRSGRNRVVQPEEVVEAVKAQA